MKKENEMMVDDKGNVLKGQYNLAQGNAFGLNASEKIVRAGMFFKGLSLFRTKRHKSQFFPENNGLQFRPQEASLIVCHFLADDYRGFLFTTGRCRSTERSRRSPGLNYIGLSGRNLYINSCSI